jgi:hypothetical protein
VDLHHLLLAGLPAHLLKNSKMHPAQFLANQDRNRQFAV